MIIRSLHKLQTIKFHIYMILNKNLYTNRPNYIKKCNNICVSLVHMYDMISDMILNN